MQKNAIYDRSELYLLPAVLQMFAGEAPANGTYSEGLSAEMRTYYSDYLIDNAEPYLCHDQFGQEQPIPKGNGDTISFRKYDPLPKQMRPLTEGVTPDGQSLNVTKIEVTVKQYGGYVELTDLLLMTAVDNNLVMATKLLGSQAGRTLDTISREVLAGGTNVQYGAGRASARFLLKGGQSSEGDNHYLTVDCIRRAVRFLKNQNAEKINGSYVAIIHPDCSYDLMNDPSWKYPHQYADPENIYEGEIGKIEGVRFVETTEAKIFHAEALASDSRTLTVSAAADKAASVSFNGGTVGVDELKGRAVLIGGMIYYVSSNTASALTLCSDASLQNAASVSCAIGTVIYPGEAGYEGRDVYATLVLGDNAYGTTRLENGGLQHIVKQLGSAGTSDPLNQRATAGWKATKATVRLTEAFMVRIETASTFEAGAN